jgi:hypothetical protein
MKERLTKLIKEAQERYIYAEEQAQYLIGNCVEEVVRCKDCKYWKQVTAERHACCMFGFEMDYDEYCSYGERKE